MAEITQLAVETRQKSGTAEARRLRNRGLVPGNIYGHGGDPISISVPDEVITPLVLAGEKVLDIQIEDRSQLGILRELQWDTFGTKILHFDLLRVDRDEKVEMEIPIELRGMAPGALEGGILDQNLHSISVSCPVFAVPNHFDVKISDLNIGDAIHVRDLTIPPGIEVLTPEEEIVVQVTERIEIPEEEEEGEAVAGAAEPEVIGREEESEQGDETN